MTLSILPRSAVRVAAFLAMLLGGMTALDVLADEPFEFSGFLTLGAVMLVDLLTIGWSRSSIRRLLQPGNVSTGQDLFFGALSFSGLFSYLVTGMSFGLNYGIHYVRTLAHWPTPRLAIAIWIGLPLMFLLNSLATYGAHRLLHTRWLWPLHAVHHAPSEMTVLNTIRVHPLEAVLRGAFFTLPGLICGLDPVSAAALGQFGVVIGFWQHSNIRTPFPWIERWLVAGPINHRIHHARDPQLRDRNFSNSPLIDRLFGTYAWTDEPVAMGIDDTTLGQRNPLVELVEVEWRWLTGPIRAARARRRSITAGLPQA